MRGAPGGRKKKMVWKDREEPRRAHFVNFIVFVQNKMINVLKINNSKRLFRGEKR